MEAEMGKNEQNERMRGYYYYGEMALRSRSITSIAASRERKARRLLFAWMGEERHPGERACSMTAATEDETRDC